MYCDNGLIFDLNNLMGGQRFRRLSPEQSGWPTGRGTANEQDFAPGRPSIEAPEEPHAEAWEALAVTDEQRCNGIT